MMADTTEMGYLVNLVLEGKPVTVIGGGLVAGRKIEDLLAAGARVQVVATEACQTVQALAAGGRITGNWRSYAAADLDGAFLAVAATDDESLNARVAADARERNILLNVVDRPNLCTFTVPATLRRGDLTIAVSTEGRCPSLAGVLREELSDRYGPEYEEAVRLFGELRERMIGLGWDGARIRNKVAELYQGGIAELIAGGNRRRLKEFLQAILGSGFPLPV